MTLEEFFSLERSRQNFLLMDFADSNYGRGYNDGWAESRKDMYESDEEESECSGFISFEDWLKDKN